MVKAQKKTKVTKSGQSTRPKYYRIRPYQESTKWSKKVGLLIGVKRLNQKGSTKVAAFELDNTLIETNKISKSSTREKWNWWHSSVQPKLRALKKDGFRIVVFTNQVGAIEDVQKKQTDIQNQSYVPILFLSAVENDVYCKPRTTMWTYFTQHLNEGFQVDKEKSFYVGDSAGRPQTKPGRRKDLSDKDLKFAQRIGLKFYTPDAFFFGKPMIEK